MDHSLANSTRGTYTFRINGSIYHQIGPLTPQENEKAKFSQIYFYDQDAQTKRRKEIFSNLSMNLIRNIQNMLADTNPYVQQFRHASEFLKDNPETDFKLIIHQDKNLDKRRYNCPTADEIACIVVGDENGKAELKRQICLYKRGHDDGNYLQFIQDTHSAYDPLHYVLMFPYGDNGWAYQAFSIFDILNQNSTLESNSHFHASQMSETNESNTDTNRTVLSERNEADGEANFNILSQTNESQAKFNSSELSATNESTLNEDQPVEQFNSSISSQINQSNGAADNIDESLTNESIPHPAINETNDQFNFDNLIENSDQSISSNHQDFNLAADIISFENSSDEDNSNHQSLHCTEFQQSIETNHEDEFESQSDISHSSEMDPNDESVEEQVNTPNPYYTYRQYLENKNQSHSIINSTNNSLDDDDEPIESLHDTSSSSNSRKSSHVSCSQFYSYRLMRHEDSYLHYFGRLYQQYIVDQYVKTEANRLFYVEKNQAQLRVELYKGLMDAFDAADTDIESTGKRLILPSSFTGGPRYMLQLFQDAMAIVRKYGKPDLFMTVTCNPKWPEILAELAKCQSPQDIPDIVSRVFRLKLKAILDLVLKKHILGRVKAHMYVIEFQKRG